MNITKDIKYVGVNDHDIDLFEGQYVVENGMAYNSYVIIDEKIAVMDTVDARFRHEWLDNLADSLDGRKPDYLIVQHMEPDHSANVMSFIGAYPEVKVVASAKAFAMAAVTFPLSRRISASLNCRKASSLEAQSAMVIGICRLACRVA